MCTFTLSMRRGQGKRQACAVGINFANMECSSLIWIYWNPTAWHDGVVLDGERYLQYTHPRCTWVADEEVIPAAEVYKRSFGAVPSATLMHSPHLAWPLDKNEPLSYDEAVAASVFTDLSLRYLQEDGR